MHFVNHHPKRFDKMCRSSIHDHQKSAPLKVYLIECQIQSLVLDVQFVQIHTLLKSQNL